MNKKVKQLAMLSALSYKVKDGNMIVVDNIAYEKLETKTVVAICSKLWALAKRT